MICILSDWDKVYLKISIKTTGAHSRFFQNFENEMKTISSQVYEFILLRSICEVHALSSVWKIKPQVYHTCNLKSVE